MVRKQVEKLMQNRNHVNTQRIMAAVDSLQRNVGVQSHQPCTCEEMPSRGKKPALVSQEFGKAPEDEWYATQDSFPRPPMRPSKMG